jgi:hypothetical protein
MQTIDVTLLDRHVTVILNVKRIIDNQAQYTNGRQSTARIFTSQACSSRSTWSAWQ